MRWMMFLGILASTSALAGGEQGRRPPAYHVGVSVAAAGAVQSALGVGVVGLGVAAMPDDPHGPSSLYAGGFLAVTGTTQVALGLGAVTTGTVLALTNRKRRTLEPGGLPVQHVTVVPTPRGFTIQGRF